MIDDFAGFGYQYVTLFLNSDDSRSRICHVNYDSCKVWLRVRNLSINEIAMTNDHVIPI